MRRAQWTGALRAGFTGAGVTMLLIALQRLVAHGLDSTQGLRHGVETIPTILFVGVIAAKIGAWKSRRRALRDWPVLWDRAMDLPNTIETCASLADREEVRPWRSALLAQAARVPVPGPDLLSRWIPLRARGAAMVVIAAVLLQGIALALPPTEPDPTPRPREVIARARALLATQDVEWPIATVLETVSQTEGPVDWDSLLADVEAWRDLERRKSDRRHRAAFVLESATETSPLVEWLIRGEIPAELPELSASGRDLLARAARELDESDRVAKKWLSDVANGRVRATPDLSAASEGWRMATALAELLKSGAQGGERRFSDERLADGGSTGDTPTPSGRNQDEGQEPAAVEDVRIGPGVRLGTGEVIEAGPLVTSDLEGDPDWDRVLGSPRVEAHWIPVVDAYRRLGSRPANEKAEQDR